MGKLIILTDSDSRFLVSIEDQHNYTSMDVDKIRRYFETKKVDVDIKKFYELDLTQNYSGVFILYQTSETPGGFYKKYIEDIIFFLEKQGAIVLPKFEYLKAHHDKVYMEMMRTGFSDSSLKTIKSRCFGSWIDAQNYEPEFPVVVKWASGAGSAGVFLLRNKYDYNKCLKLKGQLIYSSYVKNVIKKVKKYISPSESGYLKNITPVFSKSLVVQTFIEGLNGDFKVLIFGNKYYTLYRRNRDNDFRASGSGKLYEVAENEHEGLLNYARKITYEIDFPILGIDIGYDGAKYHLIEFQMIHIGPYTLQASKFWHEFHDGKWIRFDGNSDLEEEFSRSIYEFLVKKY
jgi:glutathione synthase/RimK-type ligase-like ATP-grasp enzyme